MILRRALAVLLAVAVPSLALAQRTPLYQSGANLLPGDAVKYLSNGEIGKAGGLLGDNTAGKGFNPFSITDSLAPGLAINSGPTGSAYQSLTIGHDSNGNALIDVEPIGGAAATDFLLKVDGNPFTFHHDGTFSWPPNSAQNFGSLGLSSTTPSTSPTTGALTVAGGLGFGAASVGQLTDPAITTALAPLVTLGNSTTITAPTIRAGGTGDDTRDVMQSVAYVPSGTTLNGVNSFAAYMQNDEGGAGAAGNGVMFYGNGVCNANSSECWGVNTILADNLISNTTTSKTGIKLIQFEGDYQVTSPNTVLGGINEQLGLSTAQPAAGDAFSFSPGSNSIAGVPIHWSHGFVCNDAATIASGACMFVGAQTKSGTNIPSQNINFNYFDGSGTEKTYTTGVSASQQFFIQSSSGASKLATGEIDLPQTGQVAFGADQILASGSAGTAAFASGGSITGAFIGNGTATLTLSVGNGGAAAKYVCADASNKIVIQAGAC